MSRVLSGPRDDRGSLIMASLFIIIAVGLTTLLASTVVTQITSSRVQVQRVGALQAAQAGLDTALAQIREADDGTGNGVRTDLPCGPFSGSVGGGTSTQYTVTIYYVATDPRNRMTADSSWFAAPANHLTCTPGSGPSAVPRYAVLYSTGTVAGSTRSLHGAYRLRTALENILGGRIHIVYTASSTRDLCMDAGNLSTIVVGVTKLQMLDCDTTGTRLEQIFAYPTDSTIMLVNSVTATNPLGLCLDAGPLPHVNGAFVVFQPCQSPAPLRQRWLMGDAARLEGAASDTTTDGYAMQLDTANTPGYLKLTNTPAYVSGKYSILNGFLPDAKVGSGSAGAPNNQLVNFSQFGRCFDLNGGNYLVGYMIAWQCKPSWNQRFTLPTLSTSLTSATLGKIVLNVSAGVVAVTPPGMYCLQSPRSTASGAYPKMVPCSNASAAVNLQWTVYGNTGDYTTSYRITDVDGSCLQAADPAGPTSDIDDYGDLMISRIVVRPCTGSTLQKWNADPNVLDGIPLKYVGEK